MSERPGTGTTKFEKSLLWLMAAGVALLAVCILCFAHYPIGDEIFLYKNIVYAHTVSPSVFITTYTEQTPGPLYELVHYTTYLLGQNILFIRLDNLLLSLGNIFLLRAILAKNGEASSWLHSLLYICIPLSWVNTGMALTECPALFFLLLSFLLLSDVLNKQKATVLQAAGISLFLSLAVTGRSTYLVVPVALVCLYVYTIRKKEHFLLAIMLLSLILPCCLFYVWGGLVPSTQAYTLFNGYNWGHFLAGIIYSGYCLFIIYPNVILNIKRKPWLFILTAAFMAVILSRFNIHVLPFVQFIPKHYYQNTLVNYLLLALYTFSSSLFIVSMYAAIADEKKEFYIFLSLVVLFMICSNIKIGPYFSSNYIFQFAPLLILIFRNYFRRNILQFSVNMIGIIAGVIALLRIYGVGHIVRHW